MQEINKQRKKELKQELAEDRWWLAYFEALLKKNKYDPHLIKPIIRYYAAEIKNTVKTMVGLGKNGKS